MLRKFRRNMSNRNRGSNPQRLNLWMTQTSEILGVGFVNVHPVLAVADAVEVPGCGEQSIETSRCYLRHLILVLRPLFPHMDLGVGFQLHVYTYRCMYNTQTNMCQRGGKRSLWGSSCFIHIYFVKKIPRSHIYTDIVTNMSWKNWTWFILKWQWMWMYNTW